MSTVITIGIYIWENIYVDVVDDIKHSKFIRIQ